MQPQKRVLSLVAFAVTVLIGVGMAHTAPFAPFTTHVPLTAARVTNSETHHEEVEKLLKERLDNLVEVVQLQREGYKRAEFPFTSVLEAEAAVLSAKLELAKTPAEEISIREGLVQKAQQLEEITSKRVQTGEGTRADYLKAKAFRLRAQADLLQARSSTEASDATEGKDLKALAQARLDLIRKDIERREDLYKQGVGGPREPQEIYLRSRRLLDAERDVSDRREDQVSALQAHFDRMKQLHERRASLRETAVIPESSLLEVDLYRLEAEFWLAKAKAK